ncbi:hypothetical protein KDK77_00135 [bacterium]|nr:hypothetical protein [bacterium]MCP5461589.1 hypothetical protein [bacterium]
MLKRISIMCVLAVTLFCNAGCVSEWVNQAIGKALEDPEPLVTPENPDEPLFDPESEQLIEHSTNEDIKDRFQNVQ